MKNSGPRNRRLFEQGQARREEIRLILLAHDPLAPPLTAKQIQRRLSSWLSTRGIQWHVHSLRSAQFIIGAR